MCIVFCPNIVQITMYMYFFVTSPCHTLPAIMHEVVDESLRKICHYQQKVPQHYYLLDTLVCRHLSIKRVCNNSGQTVVVYHLSQKFRMECKWMINFVSPNGNFLGKTGFLQR